MTITLQSGTENKTDMNLKDSSVIVTIDPTAHTASNHNMAQAAQMIDCCFGRSQAMALFALHRALITDNTLWSQHGKWLGRNWSRSCEV